MIDKDFTLSYVLTTFNKIDFIKHALNRLVLSCSDDEEIVIVDGGSNDGTSQYLQELFDQGLIHQFISEKDFGEGHGFNKALLMARGRVIKFLTDDDVFYYQSVKACKHFMLSNPHVDFLNTHGGWYDLKSDNEIFVFTKIYEEQLKNWVQTGKPFAFCMLGAMFNRQSLSLLGLLNPVIKRADAEYSLRITSQKIKMAWYSGVSYVRILNDQSNSAVFNQKIQEETQKLNEFYGVSIDGDQNQTNNSLLAKGKAKLSALFKSTSSEKEEDLKGTSKNDSPFQFSIQEAFNKAYSWMDTCFQSTTQEFLTN